MYGLDMIACRKCGLPFSICSSLAMYRKAAAELDSGNETMAKHYARSAREIESRYRGPDADNTETGISEVLALNAGKLAA